MAIDYFLTLHQFGSDANEARVRDFLMNEFPLVDHVDTNILTDKGLSVNVFVDDDIDDSTDALKRPDLVISFRISKYEDDTRIVGYQSMRRIVDRVVRSFYMDQHVADEHDQYIFLTEVAGEVTTKHQDHDFWRVGDDLE